MLKGWLNSSILGLVFAILIVIFAIQNTATTSINFLFYSISGISVALVLLISVLIGVICTGFVAVVEQKRHLKKIAELEKKVKEYEPVYKQ
jgi:uncharacterized integral membrane protein